MLKNFFLVLVLIAAAAAGYIATRPSEFLVVRTRTLAAPPEIVHAHVNDLHQWVAWSPWERIDPAMQREYSGPPAGPGASYHWVGNEEIGEGRMTITDSVAPDSVTIRLDFLKPFQATNTARFDIVRGGLGTEVTWSMTGRNNFMAKAIGLVMNMDKMIGGNFEQGLAELDAVTAAATPPPEPEPLAEPQAGEAPPAEGAPAAEAPPAAETAPAAEAPDAPAAEPPTAAPPAAE